MIVTRFRVFPEDIFEVNGWVLKEDGGYADERQRWLVFTDSETPEFIGCFREEFTPNGNTEKFYEDIDNWLENRYNMD